MNHVRIFQGHQIGGCVTVISAVHNGEIHRIMIDYGASLPGSEVEEDFTYPWEDEPVDAVFFTHYHGDHTGRIMEIPPEIPLYMGPVARQVMINIHEALGNSDGIPDAEDHKREAELLKDDTKVKEFFYNGKLYDAIDIPGFHIEPYMIDHSAYDAYMFLVEAEDDTCRDGCYRILHTGDFRGHGRRGHKMIPLIEAYVKDFGKRTIDALVIEGTMMSRPEEEVLTEYEMQTEALKYLRKNKYAFLICSSTNVDSLASFYQAAQMAAGRQYGRWMYVYSTYFRKQLQLYTNTAGNYSTIYRFEKVGLLQEMDEPRKNERMKEAMTQQELMERFGFLAAIKPEKYCEEYIDRFMEAYRVKRIEQKPVIIYSMWEGYIDKEDKENKAKNEKWIKFLDKQKQKGIEVAKLHTSGHATLQMLAEVIKTVNPTDAIYPMHTERAGEFKNLDIGFLKDKVVPADDSSYVRAV